MIRLKNVIRLKLLDIDFIYIYMRNKTFSLKGRMGLTVLIIKHYTLGSLE